MASKVRKPYERLVTTRILLFRPQRKPSPVLERLHHRNSVSWVVTRLDSEWPACSRWVRAWPLDNYGCFRRRDRSLSDSAKASFRRYRPAPAFTTSAGARKACFTLAKPAIYGSD